MFEPSSKVLLTESTHHKTIGPKRGSLCYIVNNLASSSIRGHGCIAILSDVVFVRYGFEERRRCEQRQIIFVLPSKDSNNKTSEERIKDLSTFVNSNKNDRYFNDIKRTFNSPSKTSIAMAIPYVASDLSTCDVEEFQAWASSIILNSGMSYFLNSLLVGGQFQNFNDEYLRVDHVIEHFRKMTIDRMFFNDTINEWTKNTDKRKSSISKIRLLQSLSIRGFYKSVIESICEELVIYSSRNKLSIGIVYEILKVYLNCQAVTDSVRAIEGSLYGSSVPEVLDDIADVINKQKIIYNNDLMK